MRRIILGLLITSAVTPSVAAGMPFRGRFIDEKSGYVVTSRDFGGSLKVTGRHPETGQTFALKVSRRGAVSGLWNGRQVAFKIGELPRPNELDIASTGAGAK